MALVVGGESAHAESRSHEGLSLPHSRQWGQIVNNDLNPSLHCLAGSKSEDHDGVSNQAIKHERTEMMSHLSETEGTTFGLDDERMMMMIHFPIFYNHKCSLCFAFVVVS